MRAKSCSPQHRRGTRRHVAVNRLALREEDVLVVAARDAHVHAGSRPVPRAIEPGVLEGLRCHFEHEPGLRVHRRCFSRGDSEELGVKAIDFAQKPTSPRVGAPRDGSIRVVDRVSVPSLGGDIDDGIEVFLEEVQKRTDSFCAGKTAAHSNDRNRFSSQHGSWSLVLGGRWVVGKPSLASNR